MKTLKKTWMAILAVALILCMSMAAFAETVTEPAEAPAEQTEVPETETAPAEETQSSAEALNEALKAYASAKSQARAQKRQDALKTELDGYVEAGTMTQEQADLILNAASENKLSRKGMMKMPKNGTTNTQPAPQNGQSSQTAPKTGRGMNRNNQPAPQNGQSVQPNGRGMNRNSQQVPQNGRGGRMMPQSGSTNMAPNGNAVPNQGSGAPDAVTGPTMGFGRMYGFNL